MFAFLVISTFSSIYTLDAGNDGIRVGIASNEDGVGIQPSSRGLRPTPNFIGLMNETRGNETRTKITYGYETIITKFRDAKLVQHNPFKFLANHNGYKLESLHPSVASALLLRSIVQTISQKDQIIVSVPSSSSPHYRSSMHEMAQIAGFSDVEIIDQSTALASAYVVEKINRTKRKDEKVIFIDIGYSQCEITQWKFSPIPNRVNMTLEKYHYTDKISGMKIDELFALHIKSKLNHELDEESLIKIGRRAKEILSSEENAEIYIHQLNTTINITRDEARKITNSIISSLSEILNGFHADTVELVGGATKFFAIQEKCKELFGESCKSDINSEEIIALGAAYYAALKAKILGNVKLFIDRPAIFDYFVNKNGKTVKLLSGGQPYTRKFFNALEKSRFEFTLSAELPKSLHETVDVEEAKSAKGPFTLVSVDGFEKYEGRGDEEGRFFLNVTLLPTRGYGEYIVTQVSGKGKRMLFDVSERCPDDKRAPSGDSFETMKKEVNAIKTAKPLNVKLELEGYLAELEDKITFDPDMGYVITKEEMVDSLNFISETRQSMANLTKKRRLTKLLNSAQLRLSEFVVRAEEHKERPSAAETLKKAIEHIEHRIPSATSDDATINSVKDFIQSSKDYMKMAMEIDRYSTPVILAKDLRRRAENVMKKETDLFAGKRASNSQEL